MTTIYILLQIFRRFLSVDLLHLSEGRKVTSVAPADHRPGTERPEPELPPGHHSTGLEVQGSVQAEPPGFFEKKFTPKNFCLIFYFKRISFHM